MSYIDKEKTSDALSVQLRLQHLLTEDEASKLIEAFDAYIDARIDDKIDQLFNRGDYRG
jgi:hypothetical protein